jgi:hypothetical protein
MNAAVEQCGLIKHIMYAQSAHVVGRKKLAALVINGNIWTSSDSGARNIELVFARTPNVPPTIEALSTQLICKTATVHSTVQIWSDILLPGNRPRREIDKISDQRKKIQDLRCKIVFDFKMMWCS